VKLLANENIPRLAVEALRVAGHDVAWIAERSPSVADEDVLALAVMESRVLLTFDKDFGELAFSRGLPSDCGVVLLRLPPVPAQVAGQIVRALETGVVAAGKFVVIEADRVRERPTMPPRR
jgi:predicted nuclease of predicted toxin-antitoxin system